MEVKLGLVIIAVTAVVAFGFAMLLASAMTQTWIGAFS